MQPVLPGRRHQRSLYLRWRPSVFAEVVGQEAVVRTLRNAVARGTVGHAYLLCGPRGTGKTSLARILYKALNCAQPHDGDPCGSCASCQASDAGRALDLIEIDAASNRGIDDMRALRERARFAPTEARVKVYIVDEAHQLTQPAWDAFLKTLEEPPPNTVFVLATTAAHRVPPTIVSRCQRFDLGRIPQGRIAEHLQRVAASEGFAFEAGVPERIARLARGGMRDALSMLEQLAAFGGSPVTLEGARQVLGLVRGEALQSFVDALASRDAARALLVLEDVAAEGADLRQFLEETLLYLRGVMLVRLGAEAALGGEFGHDELRWLGEVAEHWGAGEVAELVRAFGEIGTTGIDERQLLTRLELATARAAHLARTSASSRPPPHREPLPAQPPAARGARPVGSDQAAEVRPEEGAPGHAMPPGLGDATRTAGDPPAMLAAAPPGISQAAGTGGGLVNPSSDSAPLPGGAHPPGAPAAAGPALSLATLQARWPLLLERFQGPLLARLQLERVTPVDLSEGVVTLSGEIDRLDVQRLETQYRAAVETLLCQDSGHPLRVRFGAHVTPEPSAAPREAQLTPAEFAAELFGGHLIPLNDVEAL